MSAQITTTLWQTRNSGVEAVLVESNKRNIQSSSKNKNKQQCNPDKRGGFFGSSTTTREFGDLSNFFSSNDWVPFDGENMNGSNFFSSCHSVPSENLFSPRVVPFHQEPEWSHDYGTPANVEAFRSNAEKMSGRSQNGIIKHPFGFLRARRRHDESSSSCEALYETKDLNHHQQHDVSKEVANAWVSMESTTAESSKNNTIVDDDVRDDPSNTLFNKARATSYNVQDSNRHKQPQDKQSSSNKRHCLGKNNHHSRTSARRPLYCGSRRIYREASTSQNSSTNDPYLATTTRRNGGSHNKTKKNQDTTTRNGKPSCHHSHNNACSLRLHGRIKIRNRPATPVRRHTKMSLNNNSQHCKWKSAKDPKSGRTYYFHTETRETQWRKPMELASQAERDEMQAKEQKQKDFFAAMEANILKNLSSVILTPALSSKKTIPAAATKPRPRLVRPAMVRTISSMDENVLRDLTRVPSRRSLSNSGSRRSSVEEQENSTADSTRSLGMGDLEVLEVRLDPLMEASRELDESSTNMLGTSMSHFGEASISDFGEASKSGGFDCNFMLSPTPEEGAKSLPTNHSELIGESLVVGESEEGEASSSSLGDDSLTFEELRALNTVEQAAEEMKRSDDDASTSQSAPSSLSLNDSVSTIRADNLSPKTQDDDEEDKPKPTKTLARPKMFKRNTCGTIYVGTTMSAPDKDATIKCVCGVYRAHLLQSAKEEAANFMGPSMESDKYLVFNDFAEERNPNTVDETSAIESLTLEHVEKSIPTLDEITGFYRDVFRRSQMETDCIIMSLIYVERLIKDTAGALRPRVSNWRSILFSCMVLSSKVWDDLSMWNADFSQTCPAGIKIFTLTRINELEIALLTALKYNVKVKSSEYAKYYFLTRSMIIKSGLGGDDLASMAPLDVEGAKKLEQVSSNFNHQFNKRPGRLRATKSLDHAARTRILKAQLEGDLDDAAGTSSKDHSPVRGGEKGKVSLEHVVNM